MPEAVEDELCLLEVLDVLNAPEAMRCVLLWMLEAVDGGLCLREALEVLELLEVMRCVLLCMGGTGGDTLCATLYAEGCGGFEICWRVCAACCSLCWRLWR